MIFFKYNDKTDEKNNYIKSILNNEIYNNS